MNRAQISEILRQYTRELSTGHGCAANLNMTLTNGILRETGSGITEFDTSLDYNKPEVELLAHENLDHIAIINLIKISSVDKMSDYCFKKFIRTYYLDKLPSLLVKFDQIDKTKVGFGRPDDITAYILELDSGKQNVTVSKNEPVYYEIMLYIPGIFK